MKVSTTTDKPISSSTLIVPRPRSEMRGMTRRVLRFLLAPQTLWVLLLVPLCVVLYKAASQFEMPLLGVLQRQLPLLSIITLAALGLGLGSRLRAAVDRLGLSQQLQQEHLLAGLLEQMDNFDEVAEAIYHTCQVLNEAYQATPIHFFFRATESRDLKLVYSYGSATEIIMIPEDARLRGLLKREGQPLEYPFPQGIFLPPQEQGWLERLQARLLIPMTGKDHRLQGLITLGEKRTDTAYSEQDCALLAAISQQITRRLEMEEQRHQIEEQAKAPLAMLARLEAELTRAKQTLALTPPPVPNNPGETPNETTDKPSWI